MESPSALAGHWHESCRRDDIAAGLDAIHREVAGEVSRRGPACWASGRCCNFEQTGHMLYVTGLEAAYVLRRLDESGGRRQHAAQPDTHASRGARVIALEQIAAAKRSGGCPFLRDNACSIHDHRPLGCRIYFCDRGTHDWQRELYERMQTRVRDLHNSSDVRYVYAEWRELLSLLSG